MRFEANPRFFTPLTLVADKATTGDGHARTLNQRAHRCFDTGADDFDRGIVTDVRGASADSRQLRGQCLQKVSDRATAITSRPASTMCCVMT